MWLWEWSISWVLGLSVFLPFFLKISWKSFLLHEKPSKGIWKLQLVQKADVQAFLWAPKASLCHTAVLQLFCNWLTVCFWVQLKEFVILPWNPFIAWVQEYLRNWLILMGLSCPNFCWQKGHAVGLISQGILTGRVQKKSLFCCSSTPSRISCPQVRFGPILLALGKILKTWLCQLTWATSGGMAFGRWLMEELILYSPHPCTLCSLLLHPGKFYFNWILNIRSLFIFLMFYHAF